MDDRCVCFHCGGTPIWQSDFMADEMGYEENGIVHILTCPDCGAEITYMIPLPDEEEETDDGAATE